MPKPNSPKRMSQFSPDRQIHFQTSSAQPVLKAVPELARQVRERLAKRQRKNPTAG
jgi:hypothetical protein